MDPDKQTTFDSNATTPTRLSIDHERVPHHPSSGDTLQEEKTNELRAMESPQPEERVARDEVGDIEKEEEDIERGGEAPLEDENAPKKDPNLVEWDGPDDPENPQNWPKWKKWVYTMTLSSLTVWITFASSVFSEATLVTAEEFGVSTEVTTLGTSLVVFVSDTVQQWL